MLTLGIIGGSEILIIALIILVLFGGKKIPELMRGLGKGMKEYKNAVNGIEEEVKKASNATDIKPEADQQYTA